MSILHKLKHYLRRQDNSVDAGNRSNQMKVLLASALAILGHSAHAGEFTLLIFEKPAELAKRTDPSASQNYWQSYNAYADLLVQAGVMRGGTALDENEAETIRDSNAATG